MTRQRKTLVACGWFLLWTLLFSVTIEHLFPLVFDQYDVVFAADTAETIDIVENFKPEHSDTRKHPLFVLVMQPTVSLLQVALQISSHQAIKITLAILAGLISLLMFHLLQQHFVNRPRAALITTLYMTSFSNLVILSLPETYAVSITCLLLFLIAFLKFRDNPTLNWAVLIGAIIGLAGLANAPLLTLGAIPACYLLFSVGNRPTLVFGTVILMASVGVFLTGVAAVFGLDYFTFAMSYFAGEVSINNFNRIGNILNACVNFFLYSMVGPGESLHSIYVLADLQTYIGNGAAILAIGLLGTAAVYAVGIRMWANDPLVWSFVIWLMLITGFYVYFNPTDVILFSAQVLPFIWIIIASGTAKISNSSLYYGYGISYLLAAAGNNLTIIMAGIN